MFNRYSQGVVMYLGLTTAQIDERAFEVWGMPARVAEVNAHLSVAAARLGDSLAGEEVCLVERGLAPDSPKEDIRAALAIIVRAYDAGLMSTFLGPVRPRVARTDAIRLQALKVLENAEGGSLLPLLEASMAQILLAPVDPGLPKRQLDVVQGAAFEAMKYAEDPARFRNWARRRELAMSIEGDQAALDELCRRQLKTLAGRKPGSIMTWDKQPLPIELTVEDDWRVILAVIDALDYADKHLRARRPPGTRQRRRRWEER